MLILITDKCNLACKHCMHSCSPKNEKVMDDKTFEHCLEVASQLGASVINIAGGEPTMIKTGMLQNRLTLPLFKGFIVTLETNGHFLEDESQIEMLTNVAQLYPNFFIQISSFKEYYTNRDKVLTLWETDKCKQLRQVMGERLTIVDESNSQILLSAIGRASDDNMIEKSREHNRFPSCINPALFAKQFDFAGKPCALFESYARFCSPMIDPDGGIHMGESMYCGQIGHINDHIEEICDKMQHYKPCGKCLNYKWHFECPETPKEKQVAEILGLTKL